MLASRTTPIIFPLRGKVSPLLARTAENDINFRFTGRAYVPYSGAQADFTWEVLASGFTRAQGIYTTAFGVAEIPPHAMPINSTAFGIASIPLITAGSSTTNLGSPRLGDNTQHVAPTPSTAFGTPEIAPHAMPIYSTVFGTPNSPYLQTGVPDGFSTTLFGTGRRFQFCRVSSTPPSTVFSPAYTATNRTAAASGGDPTTAFGTPVGVRRVLGGGVLTQAYGFIGTQFGTPVAAWRQSAAATGSTTTIFGTPTYTRGGAQLATGFSKTRLGRPRASIRFDTRYASGSTSTNFGTPSSTIRNRVTSLGLLGAFGTPLLQRSTTC